MKRALAQELKRAGFPIQSFHTGHKFFPNENDAGWTEAAQKEGIILNAHALENRLQDLRNGYYCPNLSELIAACGDRFARLYVVTATWTAESDDAEQVAFGDSPEEAVGRLWLAMNAGKVADAGR